MKRLLIICFVFLITLFGCSNNSNSIEEVISKQEDVIKEIELINNIEEINNSKEVIEELAIEETKEIKEEKTSKLEMIFIDVGQGDSTLITCGGEYLLIDGGPSSASSILYTYLEKLNVDNLDYVICTHPDEDHVGGIAGALNYASLGKAYCPKEGTIDAYYSFDKFVRSHDSKIEIPEEGETFKLGDADVEILSLNIGEDNDASIVTKISLGTTSFLFMGDAEAATENYLINNKNIDCDVIKIGHHGSKYSTSETFLNAVNPSYAIISVGKDNTYGHPSKEILTKLEENIIETYRTDIHGDIICVSNGNSITFKTEKNNDSNPFIELYEDDENGINERSEVEYTYVLNLNSHKFHYWWCDSVSKMKEKNKKYSNEDRDEIVAQGYDPCQRCNP